MARLRTDLDGLPHAPGVYLMKDEGGDILYVGKAVDLHARVRQYFARNDLGDGRFHIAFLVPRIAEVEVQVTATEREALILENTLIKKFQPPYNVKLKDDKTWLSVRLPTADRFPRVSLVRRWRDDGARYYGPYLNEVNARQVLKLLSRTVPLRTCNDAVFRAHKARPCIEHAMGRCAGPCAGLVDEDGYGALVDEARALLEGRSQDLIRGLTGRMEHASASLEFERAAAIRDSIQLVRGLKEKQNAQVPGGGDLDVFALHREGELAAVALLPVRDGAQQDVRAFTFRDLADDDAELLGRLISQLYSATVPPPPEILVPVPVADQALRAELLSELGARKVRIRVPHRGAGKALLDATAANAEVRFQAAHSKTERAEQALFDLQKALRLPGPPRRIECYDNSHHQGTDTVGALVTFVDARPWKEGYRIFRVRGATHGDDYATMREVLGRRMARAGEEGWTLPDLMVIDGGRGQLAQVVDVCGELGVAVIGPDGGPLTPGDPRVALRVISIAKPREGETTDKIYEPGRSNPVAFRPHSAGLHVLQAARDEAHRFGVHHHRKQRSKRTLVSALDDVAGVGEVLRKRLLRRFGSLSGVAAATAEELAAVEGVGAAKADAIRRSLADR